MNILEHFIACIKDMFPKKEDTKTINSATRNTEVDDLVEILSVIAGGGGGGINND